MKKKGKYFGFIPFIILGVIAILSAVVMLLWNAVVTDVLNVKKLSYAQAVGLFVLCKILFGSFRPAFGGFRRGPSWRRQLMGLSPEERERFKQEWQKRCAGTKDETTSERP
jgi:hypothetical protein